MFAVVIAGAEPIDRERGDIHRRRAPKDEIAHHLANSGAVAFQFAKQGVIAIKSDAVSEEALMDLALDAGAEDVRNEGEVFEVITPPVAFHQVKEALAAAQNPVEVGAVTYLPITTIAIDVEQAKKVLKLLDELEDNDDVQNVSHNAEMPEG